MLDKHSPPVRQLLDDIDAQIAGFHGSLEKTGKTPAEHDVTRGKIKALRWVVTQIVGVPQENEFDG